MSAVASSTAAVRATTRRSLRLRVGSTVRMLALAGMPLARPRGEEQQDARVARGAHLVALLGVEVRHESRAARDRRAALLDLDLATGHEDPSALVHLVLLELLARRQVDGDHTRLRVAAKHRRLVRFHVERGDVPGLHARRRYLRVQETMRRSIPRRRRPRNPAWPSRRAEAP